MIQELSILILDNLAKPMSSSNATVACPQSQGSANQSPRHVIQSVASFLQGPQAKSRSWIFVIGCKYVYNAHIV